MNDIDAILERLRENDAISKKFHHIESRILSILNFKDLFEALLNEIQQQFQIPYAWISLVEHSDVSSLIRSLKTSDILKERMNLVSKEIFDSLIGDPQRPRLVNDQLKPFFKLLPPKQKFFFKSLALVPISMDGQLIGSLNQADHTPTRFQPGIDTSLLEQLALKVSLCLSNVTAHEKLKHLAYHDPLTGLLNRRALEESLKREYSRALRYRIPLSLVFIDLDGFKAVNDCHGHDMGDRLLKHFATRLLGAIRECDLAARYAGDEFVVVLPQTPAANSISMARRLSRWLKKEPLVVDETTIPVMISYGVGSTETDSCKTVADLLKKADQRLYRSKRKKKGSLEANKPFKS